MWTPNYESEYMEILEELPMTVPDDALDEAKAAITSFKTMWLAGQQEQWSRQFQANFQNTWIKDVLEDVTERYWFFKSYTKSVKNCTFEILKFPKKNFLNKNSNFYFINRGYNYFREKAKHEDLSHPLKTQERLDEIISVTGLARIMYTNILKYKWIPIQYIAMLFALSNYEREGEYPHDQATELTTQTGDIKYIDIFQI